jgi:NAD(P) transhydrogenase subunit alpha
VVKIAVLRETTPGETRVSASPETVKKFIALGATVSVETEAGAGASIGDSDYEAAGAMVGKLDKDGRRSPLHGKHPG